MPPRKPGLFEFVARDLAKRIFAGDIQPGEKLATEFELCDEFGVSRTVIRDALRVLGSKGLIEARPHSGTIVRGVEHWNFLDPQMITWAQDMGDREGFFDMLMEARYLLELGVVEIAALKATPEEIDVIEQAYLAMERTARSTTKEKEAFNQADIDFHLAILDATHNLILRQFGAVIKVALRASFKLALEEEEISEESVRAHRGVVEAIRRRDPQTAREEMEVMVNILRERLIRRRASRQRKSTTDASEKIDTTPHAAE